MGKTLQTAAQRSITKNFENGVFYHQTDGGAEYLGTPVAVFARIDGEEFELFTERLKNMGFKRIVIDNTIIKLD